jgi:hypothetical protein
MHSYGSHIGKKINSFCALLFWLAIAFRCSCFLFVWEWDCIYLVNNINFELVKVGRTRKMVAVAYGRRCGEANLSVLKNLV